MGKAKAPAEKKTAGVGESKAIAKTTKKAPAKKTTARQPRTYRAKVQKIFDEVLPLVIKDQDFALIEDKKRRRYTIEPTRDLNLMLVDYFKISYDTELQRVENRSDRETLYVVKASVWDQKGNKASGLGMASTKETYTAGRWEHDALAKAETRALKRAVEARCGFPIINKMIQHFFGGFVLDAEYRPVNVPQIENGGPQLSAPEPAKTSEQKVAEVFKEIEKILAEVPFSPQVKKAWSQAGENNLRNSNLKAMLALRDTVRAQAKKVRNA